MPSTWAVLRIGAGAAGRGSPATRAGRDACGTRAQLRRGQEHDFTARNASAPAIGQDTGGRSQGATGPLCGYFSCPSGIRTYFRSLEPCLVGMEACCDSASAGGGRREQAGPGVADPDEARGRRMQRRNAPGRQNDRAGIAARPGVCYRRDDHGSVLRFRCAVRIELAQHAGGIGTVAHPGIIALQGFDEGLTRAQP